MPQATVVELTGKTIFTEKLTNSKVMFFGQPEKINPEMFSPTDEPVADSYISTKTRNYTLLSYKSEHGIPEYFYVYDDNVRTVMKVVDALINHHRQQYIKEIQSLQIALVKSNREINELKRPWWKKLIKKLKGNHG